MSELRAMLADMVCRLFADLDDSSPDIDKQWSQLEDLGLPSLLLDEAHGGFNGQWQDAALVAKEIGRYAIDQPLLSTIMGRFALQSVAHNHSTGALTIAHCNDAQIKQCESSQLEPTFLLTANLRRVPLAHKLPIVISGQSQQRWFVALLENATQQSTVTLTSRTNTYQSLEADLTLKATPLRALYWLDRPFNLDHLAALLHCSQIAGALERLVDMSVQYTSERQQFGRALSKFQVIQHGIAQLAEQAAAVSCAAEAAARALDCEASSHAALVEIAAAKLRANMAIPLATGIAHQVHGAIGFTEEHTLHRFTQRLFAWRSEYGNDRYWANVLGQWCLNARSEGLWHSLTARSDRQMATVSKA